MVGSTLNHDRVLRQLGAGGMGEVFEAEDTKLHRKVALKLALSRGSTSTDVVLFSARPPV